MPQLDLTMFPSQIFWLIATFALLYILLALWIVPRIGSVLETRQQKIRADIDTAETLRREAEIARQNYESALKESRAKARNLISESTALIEKSSSARHTELEAKISKQLSEADASILQAKEAALTKLVPVSKELVQNLAEKLTGHKPAASEVDAAVATIIKGASHA